MVTVPRIIAVFVVALAAMSAVFAWRYSDLMYLRQPVANIESRGREAFDSQADLALARTNLTRRHLETIADAAARFGEPAIELKALMRQQKLDPLDLQTLLRLADAFRRAGDLARAEALFRDVLSATGGAPQ